MRKFWNRYWPITLIIVGIALMASVSVFEQTATETPITITTLDGQEWDVFYRITSTIAFEADIRIELEEDPGLVDAAFLYVDSSSGKFKGLFRGVTAKARTTCYGILHPDNPEVLPTGDCFEELRMEENKEQDYPLFNYFSEIRLVGRDLQHIADQILAHAK